MYADWMKKWLDWMYWWLPNTGQSSDEKKPESTTSTSRPSEPEPAAPVTETSGGKGPEAAGAQQAEAVKSDYDDLTAIKGIGPAMQQKLTGLGITSFEQLAAADPKTLADQLNARTIKADRIREWAAEAKKLAAG